MSRLIPCLGLAVACAHTPSPSENSEVRVHTPTSAASAPAVTPSLRVLAIDQGCEAHGGDGDHVPLTRAVTLGLQLGLSDPGEIEIHDARWTTELAGRPLVLELGPTPATITHPETLWLRGDRTIDRDQSDALEQGVRNPLQRTYISLPIELTWTQGEQVETAVRTLSVLPSGCFDPPPRELFSFEDEEPETLEPSEIARVMATAHPVLRSCWERALIQDPFLRAAMSPSFTIASDGTVQGLDLHCDSCDDELTACIHGALEPLRFPPPPHGGTVEIRYPWSSDAAD